MPEIECIWCQVEATYASMTGTIYEPDRHRVVEHSHWIDMLRLYLPGIDFFLYHHLETGRFVLAAWTYRPNTGKGPGLMSELETLDCHPDHEGATEMPHLEYLKHRCVSPEIMAERCAAKVRRIVYCRDKERRDEALARKEYGDHLQRKHPTDVLGKLVQAGVPWMRDGATQKWLDAQKYIDRAGKL